MLIQKKYIGLRLVVIGLVVLSFTISAKAQQSHAVKRVKPSQNVTRADPPIILTNQEYYDKAAGIADTLIKSRNRMMNMIVAAYKAQDWASIVSERKQLHSYCEKKLVYLHKIKQVRDSSYLTSKLIPLLEMLRDMETVFKNFDGFKANTPADTITRVFTEIDAEVKNCQYVYELFLIEKGTFSDEHHLVVKSG
jgi:hypothetical protein